MVRGVDLAIPPGQFVGVIGRSGAGKSTLLRMINRLAEPTEGRVVWGETDVTALSSRRLRDWWWRCAMIFAIQPGGTDRCIEQRTARATGVTPFWRAAIKAWSPDDRSLALAALAQFDMAALAPRRADHLSGGQQQRVAICRALMQEPEIVLADEPVASLDPRNARIVMDALQRINRHFGLTVLCNLHSLELALAYCDRLVGMANGRVVFDNVPAALTDAAARELYGIEAREVLGLDVSTMPNGAAGVPVGA